MNKNNLEINIQKIGKELVSFVNKEQKTRRQKRLIENTLFDWCINHEDLKKRIFKFIDVYPQLGHSKSVAKHLREYIPKNLPPLPTSVRTGIKLASSPLVSSGAVHLATDKLFKLIAGQFIGASSTEEAMRKFANFDRQGISLSFDLLGEKVLSEKEADNYFSRYIELTRSLGKLKVAPEKKNISVKLSTLDSEFDPINSSRTISRVNKRLDVLLNEAAKNQVFIHIDMEEYSLRDLTLNIIEDVIKKKSSPILGIGCVLQAYLTDADKTLEGILSLAKKNNFPLTIRLVRGAYWDHEVRQALYQGWPVPVFTHKAHTDAMFETLTERILENVPHVKLALATHNIRSIAHALALSEERGLSPSLVEYQLLYGIGSTLGQSLAKMSKNVRFYMPIGDPLWGMSYLIRRLLENVSNESFIRRHLSEIPKDGALLRPPEISHISASSDRTEAATSKDASFQKTAPLPFFKKHICHKFNKALETAKSSVGRQLPLVIDGEKITTKEALDSISPNDGETVIAKMSLADTSHVDAALEACEKSFPSWMSLPVEERASLMSHTATWMRRHRYEMATFEVHEVGKPWREADADIVEAIDFLEFYARSAVKIQKSKVTENFDNEVNFLVPRPRGPVAVIAPWNFPVAILTGMSAAALVTGNPVILKPAEQSPLCGWYVYRAFIAAGVPPGVLQFLTGTGPETGRSLVEDARTSVIAFTGSKEVGMDISCTANRDIKKQKLIKKTIIEMGGKNACIIDETADFDEAIPGCLASAFGFAGQKCSALSRLIVLDRIYEPFIRRLIKAAENIRAQDAALPDTICGPLIDQASLKKVHAYIACGKKSGHLLFEGSIAQSNSGYYVAPVIFDNLPENSSLLTEEIFGPVLSVIRVKTFKEALRVANCTNFALTGGVFSRTPSHIELAKRVFDVGNLYINRKITGAMVGRQPFGGYGLSGTGTKAGSENYLKEFYIERTISENVSRHGFAPG